MISKTKNIVTIFVLLIVFNSCEYNLKKENIIEIEKPATTQTISINLIPENGIIEIFENTTIKYNFNTFGLKINHAEFSIKENKWQVFNNYGNFNINPNLFEVGIDTLTLKLYTNSGSGSIADNIGQEGYYVEKKWIVIFDTRPAPRLNSYKSITKEGYLKITWDKCEQYNFEYYEIYGTLGKHSVNKKIYDINNNFYIDSLFIGGNIHFNTNCYVVNDFNSGSILNTQEPSPELYFEDIGLDSLRIFWNKSKFNANYKINLYNSSETLVENLNDTTYKIEQFGFGKYVSYSLYAKSIITDEYDYYDYKTHALGNKIETNWPEFAYNSFEKVFYTNSHDEIHCYDIESISIVNTLHIDNLIYQGNYSCPTNSSKIATNSSDYIYIFDNKLLENPIRITSSSLNLPMSLDHFFLANNDILAISYYGKYILIDINTKEIITSIDITDYPYYSKWACITSTQDVSSACFVTRNGLKLYSINNNIVSETYNDDRSYKSAYFNPQNQNQLFLTFEFNKTIEIRNTSDFSLLDVINLPSKTVIQNIDPVTGYLLVSDYENLYIIDISSHEIKKTIKCSAYKSKLFNSVLLTRDGYALNISNELK